MRAALITRYRAPLELTSVPDPVCPPDGVVVEVMACGICRSDWHAWTGADPDVTLPHVPRHEFCGTIVEAGADVRGWAKGDRVIAPFILSCGTCGDCRAGHTTICGTQAVPGFTIPGAFAEAIAVPHADANLTRLPAGMAPELAAALGCRVTTAWHALTGRAALRPGEWLGVWGAGGIGLAALMLGRAMGARVAVADVVPAKLALARELGAEVALDVSNGDGAAQMRAVTGGGVDVAVEALGLPVTTENAMRSCRKLGRMVQVGMPAGDHARMELPWDSLYSGQLAIFGTRGMPAHRYPALLDFLAATGLDLSPMIARRVALSDASAELALFDTAAPPGMAVITDFTA
ncbi:MAG: alcohol dehydrogenase catalytic domain-containing protein [Pseudomonadota bacterium]